MMVSKQICRKSCSSIVKPCFHVTCPSSQVKECRMGTCPGRVFSNCYSPTLYCFSWSICRFTHSQGWICNHFTGLFNKSQFFPVFSIFSQVAPFVRWLSSSHQVMSMLQQLVEDAKAMEAEAVRAENSALAMGIWWGTNTWGWLETTRELAHDGCKQIGNSNWYWTYLYWQYMYTCI